MESFDQEAYKSGLASILGISPAEISLTVTAASVRVIATIRPTSLPAATVAESARQLVLQLMTAPGDVIGDTGSGDAGSGEIDSSSKWAANVTALLGATIEAISEPTTTVIVIPAPSPPPPRAPPSSPPEGPPPSPPPPPAPPYYLEWLETGYNSLLAVTISTIVYLCLICCALLHGSNAKIQELSWFKRGQFVFTVSLATEDFISDVLYYYVQVSPCAFERLALSFECTSFASPALFYLSTTALFLPIFFYALYSGFMRGFLKALRDIIVMAWCKVKLVAKWLWGRDTRPSSLRWPFDYSGLYSHVPCDPPYRIIDWAIRRALLLFSTVIAVGLSIGFVPVALGLWMLLLLVLLFFGVNTKLFALRGYLDAYNSVLFLSDEQPRVRQVRDVNFSLLVEVLFESIPQFIIVFINETSQRHRPDSATATTPREAAAGLLVGAVNQTVDESVRDRIGNFSGLAIFTLSMSFGMILLELIPFVYRALKAGNPVIGFYIPVLELDKTDVQDVEDFRYAKTWKEGRDVAKRIARDRRRSASAKHLVATSPSLRVVEGEGADGGTGPEPKASSSGGHDGRQGLRAVSSHQSSSRRVTPVSGPLPPISGSAEQRSA